MKTATEIKCKLCDKPIPPEPAVQIFGASLSFQTHVCEDCEAKLEEIEAEKAKAERVKAMAERWREICPAAYRDTDEALLPNEEMRDFCKHFDFSQGRGFGIVGQSRQGKTRCAYLALKRALWRGMSVASCSHPQHASLVQQATAGEQIEQAIARDQLKDFKTAQVLLLDDLGKGALSPRAIAELWQLLEDRSSAGKITIWTSQESGASLRQKMERAEQGETHAPAILGRLSEFSPAKNFYAQD